LRNHPQYKAYLALGAVCFFWGTTYLGIRMALESFSPLMLVAVRFTLSGALMLAGAKLMRVRLPHGRELIGTALNGVLVLGVGNGCLAFAEEWIPSGLAALFITTSPFWMVGIEALVPGGDKIHAPTIAGMLIGFGGAAILVMPEEVSGFSASVVSGFLILQLGSFGWSLGSILQRRQKSSAHPIVSGAVQQLATGVVFMLPALLIGREPLRWSAQGVGAVLYLAAFGSIVGYSAYIYAMSALPVAVVSIYTYVNPIVAVTLGWLVYGERFGLREMIAMLVIFAGVAIVKQYGHRGGKVSAAGAR
jgi:drug/metabolite transporter (DMT)-like permease